MERSGLIHVTSLQTGVGVPAELVGLKYRAVLVEVVDGEAPNGYHNLLHKLAQAGVPVLLAGRHSDVHAVIQALRHQAVDDQLLVFEISQHRPVQGTPYLFQTLLMAFVTKQPATFRVCVTLLVL